MIDAWALVKLTAAAFGLGFACAAVLIVVLTKGAK